MLAVCFVSSAHLSATILGCSTICVSNLAMCILVITDNNQLGFESGIPTWRATIDGYFAFGNVQQM